MHRARSALATVLAVLLVALLVFTRAPPAAIEVIFLDVGQGDAVLIRSPEGKVALVDAGPGDILPLLRAHGIDSLDLLLASHPHADHIGGMRAIIERVPVHYYMDNGVPHTTSTYRNLLFALQRSSVTYLDATERSIELGSVTLRVLQPFAAAEDHNNRSIGVLLEYGEFRALLTGDSEIPELNHWLATRIPGVTLLKAAHHGSRDAVSPAWLSTTKPEIVVISVGLNNPYGHPNEWAMRYYRTAADTVLRTDLDGEVTVFGAVDGSYSIETGRRAIATAGDTATLTDAEGNLVARHDY